MWAKSAKQLGASPNEPPSLRFSLPRHIECFTCQKCNCLLFGTGASERGNFYEHDGLPYCCADYNMMFGGGAGEQKMAAKQLDTKEALSMLSAAQENKIDSSSIGECISLGIKTAIAAETQAKMHKRSTVGLQGKDFRTRAQFKPFFFGKGKGSSDAQAFDFEDRAPSVFQGIREVFGISNSEYLLSMCSKGLSGGKAGEGKSGQLFFFSPDRKYIVKTVTKAEMDYFVNILRDYHSHLLAYSDTLLCKFYGLYKIKVPGEKPYRLVVMNNLMRVLADPKKLIKISKVYDLKGSTVKRW